MNICQRERIGVTCIHPSQIIQSECKIHLCNSQGRSKLVGYKIVTMNPSDTALRGSIVESMLPTLTMQDVARYVPPKVGVKWETVQVLVIPEIRAETNIPGLSMKKCFHSYKYKVGLTLLMKEEEAMNEIRLPNEIPPK